MQLGQAQIVRSNWYDRALAVAIYSLSLTAGPHTTTTRKTYTIPANRRARVSLLPIRVRRETVATSAAKAQITLRITPSGESRSTLKTMSIKTNVVGDIDDINLNTQFILDSGDIIELDTSDISTGGTVLYEGGFLLVEYDA